LCPVARKKTVQGLTTWRDTAQAKARAELIWQVADIGTVSPE
jgi:hypothetical protein